MVRELLLLRHGEAETASFHGADFDRPLTDRGRAQIRACAGRLLSEASLPGLVVSSPAARTRATAEIVCEAIHHPLSAVRWERKIYDASLETLLEVAAELTGGEAERVLLVGHNPALSALLDYACGWRPAGERRRLSTGTLARIGLPGRPRLEGGSGTLLARSDPSE